LQWPNRDPIRGHAALRAAFANHTHAPQAFHKHIVVEPRIRIDGDRATVEVYFARLDRYESGPAARSMGRYRDVLVRCADARWRFERRVAEREASRPGTPLGAHAPV
jgi:ketosteroid isomerase-like protein